MNCDPALAPATQASCRDPSRWRRGSDVDHLHQTQVCHGHQQQDAKEREVAAVRNRAFRSTMTNYYQASQNAAGYARYQRRARAALKGLPAVRMAKMTSVWAASDSMNQPGSEELRPGVEDPQHDSERHEFI
jgi:hypothetical protein